MKNAEQARCSIRPRMFSFEPCGPISAMIEAEMKRLARSKERRPRGSKKRVISQCIADSLGPRYPALLRRFRVLQEEGLT